jgi:hypothetical protein
MSLLGAVDVVLTTLPMPLCGPPAARPDVPVVARLAVVRVVPPVADLTVVEDPVEAEPTATVVSVDACVVVVDSSPLTTVDSVVVVALVLSSPPPPHAAASMLMPATRTTARRPALENFIPSPLRF